MDKEEFKQRRSVLWNNASCDMIIIGSWPVQYLNGDVDYKYKQDPNFYYYTGIKEQDMVLIIERTVGNKYDSYIFARGKDPKQELWTGKRHGFDELMVDYGFDQAYPLKDVDSYLSSCNYSNILAHVPDKLCSILPICNNINADMTSLQHIMETQRVIKSPFEINIIKKACAISAQIHNEIGEHISHVNVVNEREIDGTIMGLMIRNGCQRLAYPNVVAAGKNGTTLHYSDNDGDIGNDDLILIDAGGELDYYASDITRTIHNSGNFTPEQKNIYDLVLKTQMECINMVKPGITIPDIHMRSVNIITLGLIELGLLEGNAEDNIHNESYKKFYMHSIGHWMGIDVHDCQTVNKVTTVLEPGHVFTVEPGIYIPSDDSIPKEYRGIAVRIEDDILVTKDGYNNMSVLAHK